MLRSLRFRLLLTLLGVVVVVVGTVALFASRVTSRELQRYVELDLERNQRITSSVMAYYTQHKGGDPRELMQQIARDADERIIVTDGAGTVLADSAGQLAGQALTCEQSFPAVIVTVGGTFCADAPAGGAFEYASPIAGRVGAGDILFFGVPYSGAALASAPISATLAFEAPIPAEPLMLRIPSIIIRRTQGQDLDPIEAGFLSAVNRSLAWSVVAASGAALLLTLLLARRIIGPIEALTAAARAMEQGDLSRRVPEAGGDEIGKLSRSFNAMADGLARQETLRRHMVTDVAHELRTPLTNIRGYLEALRDGVAHPTPDLLGSLHEEALLLNRLIDDLQDLALAEAGQLRLVIQTIDLDDVVAQAIEALRPAVVEKAISIDMALPPDLPSIAADPERVGQILRNLLNNAITHTPCGGAITICATLGAQGERRATNELVAGSSSFVTVTVSDSGSGIAPEHLPNIFERFYRADRARARTTGGAGLGLAIVRQLVERHGGRVWAESRRGQGARFSFTLPIAPYRRSS